MPVGVVRAIGIDVGARTLHLVAVTRGDPGARPRVTTWTSVDAADFGGLVAAVGEAMTIAVDAPEVLSPGAHVGDLSLPPKFRTARCCEIAAWKEHGQPPVPWVTPMADQAVPGWMATGFAVWAGLKAAGHRPLEVFPAGCFHWLNGGRWPPRKSSPDGRRARLALLADLVDLPGEAAGWSHDTIDATVLAVVADQGRAQARPMGHRCAGGDGSVMWGLAPTPPR